MKNKYLNYIFILIMIALLYVCSVFAAAESDIFVNDADSVLPRGFSGVYAIGSGGTDLLFTDKVYALTSQGLQTLGSANADGGGGLLYEDGSVVIGSDRVKVGLAYSFSEARDSSVASAVLENTNGSGFSIGYYDEYDDFQPMAETEAQKLTVRPGPDGSVDIFLPGDEVPLCTLEGTSKDKYLYVRAEPFARQPLTRYAGISYYGEFGFSVLANDRLTVVNLLDLEHYVMGVCAIEMTESWPLEALKAQAVAARTFVQKMIGSSVYYYSCGFDVTADTYTQAYRGTRGVGETIRRAVNETSNRYLTQNGALIDALYSAADGGATEDSENIFGYANDYLIGVEDPFEAAACEENPYASWTVTLTPAQLGSRLGIGPVERVEQTTSRMGNVIKLVFVSSAGEERMLIRDNCRTKLGLKNLRYEISRDSVGNFVFTGSGFGHNLGMSQWGAYAMAKYYDKDYRFILGFYYTRVGLSDGVLPPKPERPPEPVDAPADVMQE